MIIKIGEKVKLLRKKNDVTQDRLAEYLGITAQAISRWESETCYPDIELLPAIADFFGITVDELLCVDQAKKESKIKEYINEANNFQLLGDFDSAIQIYRRALREYPSSFQLQVELACAIGAIDN
ncbi:MAG TPA: XRE family transcriptional regulator, partial [Clostridiales bacterium]|nr:XRE family transcriptional regulator [Clostridiales bacterium]